MEGRILLIALGAIVCGCGGGGGGSGGSTVTPQVTAPPPDPPAPTLEFTEVALQSGLTRMFLIVEPVPTRQEWIGSGVAAVDYDNDGDIDLYVVGGDLEANRLYQNQGDGTYVDVAPSVGLDLRHKGSGPTFADIDGDGDLDLFVGAIDGDPFYLMDNREGLFVDVTAQSGIALTAPSTFSATFGDYDLDSDLDLFLSHWTNAPQLDTETVWRNDGDGTFVSASIESGIAAELIEPNADGVDLTFTPNLSDIDGDGDPDLLMAADFTTSQVFINNGDGTFTRTTDRDVIIDQAGMGASVGDYDNDGDMDWFVTSIYDEDDSNDPLSMKFIGNRLYRNDGSGVFDDVTLAAGVDDGGWGWGSCFADFDNDGHLDIFHVNGWAQGEGLPENDYTIDQVRFFRSRGDGTFVNQASEAGLIDRGLGRGVVCFDADRDGDLDIVLTNNDANHLIYYRNDSSNSNHYLGVKLEGYGVGARITVLAGGTSQIREVRAGNNFVSQNPLEAHFGLSSATMAQVTVAWQDGSESVLSNVTVDQLLMVSRPAAAISERN